jgi:hypothetical protein
VATWITHIRIAEGLLGFIPGLSPEEFTLGSIAPDSGIPDEKWEKFTPDAAITHFKAPDQAPHRCADLDFLRQYLRGGDILDPAGLSFRLGYFCHLVTDNYHYIRIGGPTQQQWQAQFKADRNFIWEVKKDWYGLDFLYLAAHPDSIFFTHFIHAKPTQTWLDFLPLDALQQRVEYIQKYHQDEKEYQEARSGREYQYLSQADNDAFVDESIELLKWVWEALWVDEMDIDGHWSVLEITP